MALTLALLEVSSLFAIVCSLLVTWAQPVLSDWTDLATIVGQALTVSLCCILSFYYNDLYDLRIIRSLNEFVPRLLKALLLAFVILATAVILLPKNGVNSKQFVLGLFLIASLILSFRAAYYGLTAKRALSERILILGTSPLGWRIAQELKPPSLSPYTVLGFLQEENSHKDSRAMNPLASPFPIRGTMDRLEENLAELHPHRVVVALTERRGQLPVRELLSSSLNGTVVEDGLHFYEKLTQKLAIETINPSSILFSTEFKKPRPQLILKRLTSLAVSIFGIFLTAPLLLIIAVLIKLGSKGPIFFVQERAGFRGKLFNLLKFRTMQCQTESNESVWDRDNESRITRLGYWLRRLHLDELPQFFNILKGDMDLVGPRPEMASNVKTMTDQIPFYAVRHMVRPGVTGWAQVRNGYSVSKQQVMEKIRYDLYYIKHMSFWFDLRILADTAKIVVFRKGR